MKTILMTIIKSKKFIYALSSIVIPVLMERFQWAPEVAEQVWHTGLVLILGQSVADFGKEAKK